MAFLSFWENGFASHRPCLW